MLECFHHKLIEQCFFLLYNDGDKHTICDLMLHNSCVNVNIINFDSTEGIQEVA